MRQKNSSWNKQTKNKNFVIAINDLTIKFEKNKFHLTYIFQRNLSLIFSRVLYLFI